MNTAGQDHRHHVTLYENLSELPDAFEALFRRAGKCSLFHTLPWYRNFVQTVLSPGEHLRIYAVEASWQPSAVLLMRYRAPAAPMFGGKLDGVANYYSSLFGPVIDPLETNLPGVLDALAMAIAQDPLHWGVVDLHPLAKDDVFAGLLKAFKNAGLLTQSYYCFGNCYLPVNGQSFEQYLDSRTSRLTKTARRKRVKLEASHQVRFRLYTDMNGLEDGIGDYNAVYNSSWKIPEHHPDFVSGLIRTCARQGWLRLGIVYLDGQPAAAQLWIVVEGTASIFKLAYDERFAKHSVGTMLSLLLMEHVIKVDKVEVVDYLTGDDPYKRDWMSERRERWGILAFNPRTPYGLFAASRHLAGRAVRRTQNAFRRFHRNET